MLGQRSAQWGMFEADALYGDFVGRKNFYGFLASQRRELFRDEDFARLYCPNNGRPSVPPSLLAPALVLQAYDGVSDDEATRRAAFDLQWKVALGIELEVRPFAKSTLQEFRAQLILHQQTGAIFQRSLEAAKRRGVWKKGHPQHERQQMKLALDTTHILGRGAVKDSYNLLADGIVQVLHVLAKLGPFEVMDLAEELGCVRYVQGSSLKGQADVDWTDPRARQRFLAEIVTDANRLLALVRETRTGLVDNSAEDKEVVEASEVATGCQVGEVLGDCAYGAGSTRAEFAATGRTVVAKVPEIHNQEFFPKTAFQIDVEAGTCTCPNQQTTADLHAAKGGGGMFVFAAETCTAC